MPGNHETSAMPRTSSDGHEQEFPPAVAHGLLMYQGLNLPYLFTELVVITYMQTLVKYGNHVEDPTGMLLQANRELLQLETGVDSPLFQISPLLSSCVTDVGQPILAKLHAVWY